MPELEAGEPDLIQKHAFELYQISPELRTSLPHLNLTLTDLASDEERVRNYSADRALRIVHGLIDLLEAWKTSSARHEPWIIACNDYDSGSTMCKRFFRELMRPRGIRSHFHLVLASESNHLEDQFPDGCEYRQIAFSEGNSRSAPEEFVDANDAEQAAIELEASFAKDRIAGRSLLPALIKLWPRAGSPGQGRSMEIFGRGSKLRPRFLQRCPAIRRRFAAVGRILCAE